MKQLLKLIKLPVGQLQTNCYMIGNIENKKAFVVDPGEEADTIIKQLKEENLKIVGILLTHGHGDHIMAVKGLKEEYGTSLKVYASSDETELLSKPEYNLSVMISTPYSLTPDIELSDGQVIPELGLPIECIKTPGHTAGGMCFYLKEENTLITGDTLFEGSIGRTDFPTGNHDVLIESIKTKLMCLPNETKVYPGHGDASTIGYERQHNPFIQGNV